MSSSPSPQKFVLERSPEGHLLLGGLSATELARRYGSPLYVLETARIDRSIQRLKAAFDHPRIRLFYAMKANPNPRILEHLGRHGIGMDCCSPGEVYLASRSGFVPEDITFTGTALTAEDAELVASRAGYANVDGLSQVERHISKFPGNAVGIRINPGFGAGGHAMNTTGGQDTKLGIPIERAREAHDIATRQGGRIRGLHVHTGSGGMDVDHFVQVAERMFQLAREWPGELDYVDLGGGLGVPHRFADPEFALEVYATRVIELVEAWNREHRRPLSVFIEPGQFFVGEAGWLLMTVVLAKQAPSGRRILLTDSSFNHYLGTSLYQSYHEFVRADGPEHGPREVINICGHLCNTGDTFARDREMVRLEEGALIAMAHAGAYGISRGSNYNSRPLPAEILVENGESTVIRPRETYEDLLRPYGGVGDRPKKH